jgi:hypothetical protein
VIGYIDPSGLAKFRDIGRRVVVADVGALPIWLTFPISPVYIGRSYFDAASTSGVLLGHTVLYLVLDELLLEDPKEYQSRCPHANVADIADCQTCRPLYMLMERAYDIQHCRPR